MTSWILQALSQSISKLSCILSTQKEKMALQTLGSFPGQVSPVEYCTPCFSNIFYIFCGAIAPCIVGAGVALVGGACLDPSYQIATGNIAQCEKLCVADIQCQSFTAYYNSSTVALNLRCELRNMSCSSTDTSTIGVTGNLLGSK